VANQWVQCRRTLRFARAFSSTIRRDFAVNPNLEPRLTLAVWRLGQFAHGQPGALFFLGRRLHGCLDFLWVRAVVGAELPRCVEAGPGLRLPHAGKGVILHSSVRIGSDVTIYHQVTIGVRGSAVAAVIEDRVYIGAGAKVIGPVTLGADCHVGANAVVTHDVAPGVTVVGVPARPL
jgi:serine O-acetyltransferase